MDAKITYAKFIGIDDINVIISHLEITNNNASRISPIRGVSFCLPGTYGNQSKSGE